MFSKLLYCSVLFVSLVKADARPYADEYKGKRFIEMVANDLNYSRPELEDIFQHVSPNYSILRKISRPAEKTTPWFKYRLIFADQDRVIKGRAFYEQNYKILEQAYNKYGVPPSIIVAILGVETRYGKVMGKDSVIEALSTIAFEYPEREKFFTKELRAFLKMTKQEGIDPLSLKGSYAGAMGMAQFMPSSYLNFAVDYDGDGKRDLWNNTGDAIFSIAHYLAANGWLSDGLIADEAFVTKTYSGAYNHKPFIKYSLLKSAGVETRHVIIGDNDIVGLLRLQGENESLNFVTFPNFRVITTYNTSPMYAMAVFELAKTIEAGL